MEGRSEGMIIRRNLRPVSAKLSLALIAAGLWLRSVAFRLMGRAEASADLRAQLRGYLTRDS
jgi:hypothetical protein